MTQPDLETNHTQQTHIFHPSSTVIFCFVRIPWKLPKPPQTLVNCVLSICFFWALISMAYGSIFHVPIGSIGRMVYLPTTPPAKLAKLESKNRWFVKKKYIYIIYIIYLTPFPAGRYFQSNQMPLVFGGGGRFTINKMKPKQSSW